MKYISDIEELDAPVSGRGARRGCEETILGDTTS
jgi:hypothetical protein